MNNLKNHSAELEVYRNVYETWRFEVNSYWQRNAYFAAFETAAIGGCWYLLEKQTAVMGLLFSILGTGLSLLWLWNNVAVHKYIKYWWQCIKDTERALGLHDSATDFANKHPGSSLKPSLGAKLVPVIFSLAWLSLVGYAIYHLFHHNPTVADLPLSTGSPLRKFAWDNSSVLDWLKESVRPDVFWVMATALGTIALVFVAQKQLKDLARTSRSDFLYRLKKDFFTEKVSDFIFLLENDLLTFRPDPIPTFDTIKKHGVKPEKDSFTTNTIDDLLLGPLEDVGVLWKLGRLSLDEVYETFDYYVCLCVENKAIADYINSVKKEPGDEDIYDHLLLLYKKLKEEGPKIRARKA
jgi:hypothetical protein